VSKTIEIKKVRRLSKILLVLSGLLCLVSSRAADFPEYFGLYAASSESSWANPCNISYLIAGYKSKHVDNKNYVLIVKHKDVNHLNKLKHKYSVAGQDNPDGKVKLYPCAAWLKIQSKDSSKYYRPVQNEEDTSGHYLEIKIQYLPSGFWPRTLSVTPSKGRSFVSKRRLQCLIGPMYESAAERLKAKLGSNRQLILKWLGRHVLNNTRGFINTSERCYIRYR